MKQLRWRGGQWIPFSREVARADSTVETEGSVMVDQVALARRFPKSFTWGFGTAAYQIEGATKEDGRGESIWDRFATIPGKTHNGESGEPACDSYHRWREDIAVLKELGATAYRFSIAWPRILPDGTGAVNPKGLAWYEQFVDGLLEAGIEPFPTLYHWDLPQALQDRGGWPSRDTAHAFADYASVVVGASTLNEPLCSAWLGYLSGDMAPGIEDAQAAFSASHHLLLGHGLAVRAARAARPNLEMGIVMNVGPAIPASDSPEDRDAARRADLTDSHWFHDPVYLGSYPQEVIDFSGVTMPIQSDDMKIISERLDWHGLNYYFPAKIADDPSGDGARTHWGHIDGPKTDMGWGIDASVMRDFLIKLKTHWKTPKIYITENGSAWPDTVAPDGRIYDPEREQYLMEHLSAAAEAIEAGVDLRGYFGWSLLDNYEWAYGYAKRFGYAYVDYPTQTRTIKESGRAFSRLIRASRGG